MSAAQPPWLQLLSSAGTWGAPGPRALDGNPMPALPASATRGLCAVSPRPQGLTAWVSALPSEGPWLLGCWGPAKGSPQRQCFALSFLGCSHSGQTYHHGETFSPDACTTCHCQVSDCDQMTPVTLLSASDACFLGAGLQRARPRCFCIVLLPGAPP